MLTEIISLQEKEFQLNSSRQQARDEYERESRDHLSTIGELENKLVEKRNKADEQKAILEKLD